MFKFKPFNVRVPVLLAFAFIGGVLLGFLFIYHGISLFWVIAVVPPAAVTFIFCAVFVKKSVPLALIVLTAVFLIAGTVSCFTRLESFARNKNFDGDTYDITAFVSERGESSYGDYLILDDVNIDGKSVDGKILAYLSQEYGDYCDAGYDVAFSAKLTACESFSDGTLSYNAINNIAYVCYNVSDISAEKVFSPFASARAVIRGRLNDNLDAATASIAYAMLTGNTQDVESETLDAFRYGGIAHIFAVSGLHIGLIYGVFRFFLKKLRLNKYLSAAIPLAVVFLYAGVCGFTLSSMRAVIMCAVSAIARLFYKKYDGLNALAVAVLLILIINPVNLFAAGFQLSVCAVTFILALSKNFERAMVKLKIPRKISSATAVSVSAQAGVLPVMLSNFGYVSGAGLLLNIVIVPLLSALFVLLFVATAIACIVPVASTVISLAALPLEAVISFLSDAGFEKAIISGFGSGGFVALYFLTLLTFSDKIRLGTRQRLTAFSVLLLITVSFALLI